MKNYVQAGVVVTLIAPSALNSGDGVLVGSIFGVATNAAANGAPVEVRREGVVDLAALNTDVAAQGAKAYWDATNKRVTITATNNTLIGAFLNAKANGDVTGRVVLDARCANGVRPATLDAGRSADRLYRTRNHW